MMVGHTCDGDGGDGDADGGDLTERQALLRASTAYLSQSSQIGANVSSTWLPRKRGL